MNQKVGVSASNPPFGIFLLIKAVKMALANPEAVKSKILGNAIYITKSNSLPASINIAITKSNNFLKLVDIDKKLVALELDKMRRPNYDLSQSIMQLIAQNWVHKTIFEKSQADEAKPLVKNYGVKNSKIKNSANPSKNKALNNPLSKTVNKQGVNGLVKTAPNSPDKAKDRVKLAPIITIKKNLQIKKS